MTFRVSVLKRARSDAESIYAWLRQQSISGATAWYEAFDGALRKLASDADNAALAPEADFVGARLRQRLFRTRRGKRYRIIFIVLENEVRILRVRGPGQAPLTAIDLVDNE